MDTKTCILCNETGGRVLMRSEYLRVIAPEDKVFPGMIRVIWNEHLSEMTDLEPMQRSLLMQTVCQVEDLMRQVMRPDKINLASLGNYVPHLHWHIIPRWRDDVCYPESIWGIKQREVSSDWISKKEALASQLFQFLESRW